MSERYEIRKVGAPPIQTTWEEILEPVKCKKCGRILLRGEIVKAEIKCMKCKYTNKFGV